MLGPPLRRRPAGQLQRPALVPALGASAYVRGPGRGTPVGRGSRAAVLPLPRPIPPSRSGSHQRDRLGSHAGVPGGERWPRLARPPAGPARSAGGRSLLRLGLRHRSLLLLLLLALQL